MKKELDALDRMMYSLINTPGLEDKTLPDCFDMILNDLKAPAALSAPSRAILTHFLGETEIRAMQKAEEREKSKIILAG